jgi:cation:H+ antiporter
MPAIPREQAGVSLDYVYVAAGLVALVTGGDMLVRGAAALALRLGMPPLVIGLTVVGFGTSLPELLTSLRAALAGSPGIALGNVVGSNIANILLILGVAALLSPMAISRREFRRDGGILALTTLACAALILSGQIGRPAGLALVAGLVLYLGWLLRNPGTEADADLAPDTPPAAGPALVRLAAGLGLLVAGAWALVAGAVSLAASWGVSESLIGLTIVAVGTSLPELATSAAAARRGQADLAFGNVVGSNIFNILGILGITALVSPLPVPPAIAGTDVWVLLAATVALIAVSVTGWRITRREGLALLGAYAAYIGLLAATA